MLQNVSEKQRIEVCVKDNKKLHVRRTILNGCRNNTSKNKKHTHKDVR